MRFVVVSLLLAMFTQHAWAQHEGIFDDIEIWQSDYIANGMVQDRFHDQVFLSMDAQSSSPLYRTLGVVSTQSRELIQAIPLPYEGDVVDSSGSLDRIYISVRNQLSFLHYDTHTQAATELRDIDPVNVVLFQPSPDDEHAVIAVKIDGGGTRSHRIYDDTGVIGGSSSVGSDAFVFIDDDLLFTGTDNSGTTTRLLSFEDNRFLTDRSINGVRVSTRVEHFGGRIYDQRGHVIDAATLYLLGTLPGVSGTIEVMPELGIAYVHMDGELVAYDTDRFLEIDRIRIPQMSGDSMELFAIGKDQLGYLNASGRFGVISGIPVTAPCRADYTGDGQVGPDDVTRFLSVLTLQRYNADLDLNGQWDARDLAIFIARYLEGCPS